MDLTEMRMMVRRDLHDEEAGSYRWTDDELDRHIARALKEYSEALPLEQKAAAATVSGSREISLAGLTGRVMIEAVEYPAGQFPARYQRFAVWNDILTLLGEEVPDGSDCQVYYGKLHTLDVSGSTIPAQHEDLVATGAAGYAALEWGVYSINKANTGGTKTPGEFMEWGNEMTGRFQREVKRLGRRSRVRVRRLYTPYNPPVSRATDWGPG